MKNFKKLIEKRNSLVEEMNQLITVAEEETRALNEEETTKFGELTEEVRSIDATLQLANTDLTTIDNPDNTTNTDATEDETRAFATYLRTGRIEEIRADVNFTTGNNGAIIPRTIADKIIETVKNIAPIYALSTKFDVKGDLVFPVYDEKENKINCAYQEEFAKISATGGKFTSITLTQYLSGALAKVSKSLVNNTQFDLVNYVITKVAAAIAEFMEHELIVGTSGKMTGVLSSENVVNAGAAAVLTVDDLVNLQLKVPQALRTNGCFIMNPDTFAAIAKLKDGDGKLLVNQDIKNPLSYTLLGCPIYESDNMPKIATGQNAIVFGDMSGIYTKIVADSLEIQVLLEKYADEHAVGVIGWVEADSKIVEAQKIAVLKMA